MSLIVEKTVGVCFRQDVYHIGVAFAHESKSWSAYGHSFRIEHSHKSGVVHTKCVVGGQGNFRSWLNRYPDILTTSVEVKRYGNKKRVIEAVIQKIENAYAKFLLEPQGNKGKGDKS